MSKELISKEDCNKILKKYFGVEDDFKLTDYSLIPISQELIGLLGRYFFLDVSVKKETAPAALEKIRFFVKTAPKGNSIIEEFSEKADLLKREASFYNFFEKAATTYNIDIGCVPKYYYAKEAEYMVLDDLSTAGFRMHGIYSELDLPHLKIAIKTAAKFHAVSLIYEEMKSSELRRKYRIIEEYNECLQECLFVRDEENVAHKWIKLGLNALHPIIKHSHLTSNTKTQFINKLNNLLQKAFQIVEPSTTLRNVWCHGDFSTKNLMFYYENGMPVKCKIYDLQIQRYAPPTLDLLMLIYQTTNKLMRQRYLEELLDCYYETLKHKLASSGLNIQYILNRNEFDCSIRELCPVVKLMIANIKIRTGITATDIYKKKATTKEELLKYLFEDCTELVSYVFQNCKTYKVFIEDLLDDLREDMLLTDTI